MKVIKHFSEFSEIVEAYTSTSECGNLSFKWSGPNVIKNRNSFFKKLNLGLDKLVMVDQPHGKNVVIVHDVDAGKGSVKKDWIEGFDGLVSTDVNIILGIESSDCLPVLAVDVEKGIIGAVHAGWQGVISGAVESLIIKMQGLGADPQNIHVVVGPHIKDCCFEIKSNIFDKFELWVDAVTQIEDKIFVNLSNIVINQLTSLGVLRQSINISEECTCCNKKKYYSYRRDKEKCKGGLLSIIKLKK